MAIPSADPVIVDYYCLLGIQRMASKDDIRSAYKGKALQLHPDKNPNGEALFKQVVNAYQTLMSPSKKVAYDRDLDLRDARRPAYGAFSRPQNQAPAPNQAYRHYRQQPRNNSNQENAPPTPSKYTNEYIFREAYSQYKKGTGSGYNANAKSEKKAYYEHTGNFSEWFKKKQDEQRQVEEQFKAQAAAAKKIEEEERKREEEWRKMQRDRDRTREMELELEKNRRYRQAEVERCANNAREKEEQYKANLEREREFTEAQKKQQHELQEHLENLKKERDELQAHKAAMRKEKEELEKTVGELDATRKDRQRQREADIAQEVRDAEANVRHVQAQADEYERQKKRDEQRRKKEAEEEARLQKEMEDTARHNAELQAVADREAEEERKKRAVIIAAQLGEKRKKVMESIEIERKKHREEVDAMRRETDRIEAEMKAKLDALRQAKKEGKPINIDDYKL
eukprot:Tbor_TRINITY_DN675_c0_g1::TRINITY_DN675_c0_g1_i1::g.1614::m.1614